MRVPHGAYSPLKAWHHRDKIDTLRAGDQPAPAQVQLILSDWCQHDCSFCAFRMSGYTSNELFSPVDADGERVRNPKRMMPAAKAIEILDDCKAMGVKAVQFTGGGEPTMHPMHESIFTHALDNDLEIALVSNATHLRESVTEILLEAAWARFSLDAASARTYSAIRDVPQSYFGRAIANIQRLVDRKQATGSQVRIGIGFVVTKDNYQEALSAATLAKELEVDNFRLSAVFQSDGAKYFESFLDDAVEQCQAAAKLSTPLFTVHNNFNARVADLDEGSPDYTFCGYQHFNTYIGADLGVYRCCNTAYSTRGLVGSLKEQSFKQLWESQAKQDTFSTFNAKGCARCMFNAQNRAILYAIDPAPPDVNFV